MPEENVEIVNQVIRAWNARDLETLRLLTHPDAEYVNQSTAVEPGTRISRTMPGSDSRLEVRAAVRWSFRDGRVARCEVLGVGPRFKQALEAARLGE